MQRAFAIFHALLSKTEDPCPRRWFLTTGMDVAKKDGLVHVWPLSDPKVPHLSIHERNRGGSITCATVSDDGELLATGSSAGPARVYRFKY